jgi:predicted Zn-dependent protease with MMP-like domain
MKPLSEKQFGRFVARVMSSLPPVFGPYLENLVVDVENEPSIRTLKDSGMTDDDIADGESLYGLFEPFPLPGEPDLAGVDGFDQPMNRIVIYKRPLEEDFDDPRELFLEIRKTVIHELAHHFGFSERDLEGFEAKEDPFDGG